MVIYEILTRVDPPARKLKDCYAFKADDFKSKLPSEIPDKLWELLCDCVRAPLAQPPSYLTLPFQAATTPADRPDFKTIVTRIREIYDSIEGTPLPGGGAATPTTKEPEKPKKPAKDTKETTKEAPKEGEKKKKKKHDEKDGEKKRKHSHKDGDKKHHKEGKEGEKKKKSAKEPKEGKEKKPKKPKEKKEK